MTKLIDVPKPRTQRLPPIEFERIEPLDFMHLLRTVWHGKVMIIGYMTAAILLAGYYAFAIATPKYAATTTLEIDAGISPVINAERVISGIATDQATINTEVAILRSRHLMEKLVVALELTKDPEFNLYLTPPPVLSLTHMRTSIRNALTGQRTTTPDAQTVLNKTIEHLSSAIAAGVVRDSYIFKITATTHDATKSALITNTLAELYLADQVDAKYAATEAAVSWLSERVFDLQIQLEAKETAVNALIVSANVNDTNVLDGLGRQSAETSARLVDTQRAMAQAQDRLLALGQNADEKLLSNARVEVARLSDQVAALAEFQTGIDARLAAQSTGLIRLQQLRREAEATRVLYENFLARLQETSIQRGLQAADSRILSAAIPGQYIAPRKMLILALAALLGAAAGVAAVFVRQALRKGFASADALRDATGTAVFAQVPRMPFRRPVQLLNYLNSHPNSAAAESIRNLRTSLMLVDKKNIPQVILSTSSIPGEGKTTVAIALAHNLVRLGKRVLLIDADVRRSAFHTHFGGQHQEGFVAFLEGRLTLEDVIVRDDRLGADILTNPKTSVNMADIFAGTRFAGLIANLRTRYDFIILDAPPVLGVPDTRLLAQSSDAILYNVRWEKTDQALVHAGKRELEHVNSAVTGLVLSQVDGKKLRRYGTVNFAAYGQALYNN